MFPIQLDLSQLRVALIGAGPAARRRLALLDEDGPRHLAVYAADPALAAAAEARLRPGLPSAADLAQLHIVFIAGLDDARAAELSVLAKTVGTLVHVEDKPGLSTVHAPAVVRRGDLVLTVSTNGRSPGLARRLKRFLEGLFGAEWQDRLDGLAALRQGWREAGAGSAEIARWTEEWVDRQNWLGEDPTRSGAAGIAASPRLRDCVGAA